MSWIQEQEERDYDTQSEYINVLRQEAYDPYEFFVDCEEHGTSFDIREGCPEYHAPVEVEAIPVTWNEEDEPPF